MEIKRIVVIEDSESLLSLLEMLLMSYLLKLGISAEIHLFSSADSYLSDFGDFVPNLILSDVDTKSRINGIELLQKIRAKVSNTFYVIMSGISENRYLALKFGADRFLEKPFKNEEIQAILRKIA